MGVALEIDLLAVLFVPLLALGLALLVAEAAAQRHSPFPVKQICAPHVRRVEAQTARTRQERRRSGSRHG